jgi:hypothetical protein
VTPTPDGAGYLPVPGGITVTQTTITGSLYAGLLGTVQDALDQEDEIALADMVYGRYMLELGYSDFEGEPVGTMLDSSGAEDYVDQFFDEGTSAIVQGYFAESSTSVPCVEMLIHPFAGSVTYPTPADGTIGQAAPTNFPLNAAVWKFCKTQSGVWIWKNWKYGEYYPTVYFMNERQKVPNAHYVIRP